MKCPLTHQTLDSPCRFTVCPYNSVKEDSGCFYGNDVSLTAFANHKGVRPATIKEKHTKIEDLLNHYIRLLKYAEFCQTFDFSPDKADMWETRQYLFPYRLLPFRFVNANTFSKMLDKQTYRAFRQIVDMDGYKMPDFVLNPPQPESYNHMKIL